MRRSVPSNVRLSSGVAVRLEDSVSERRDFAMAAYNGVDVDLGWGAPVVFDLARMEVASQTIPIFRDHDKTKIVGHSRAIANNGSGLEVVGHISEVTEHGREVSGLSDEGFPWQASVGLKVVEASMIKDGKTVQLNGRTFTGPFFNVPVTTQGVQLRTAGRRFHNQRRGAVRRE